MVIDYIVDDGHVKMILIYNIHLYRHFEVTLRVHKLSFFFSTLNFLESFLYFCYMMFRKLFQGNSNSFDFYKSVSIFTSLISSSSFLPSVFRWMHSEWTTAVPKEIYILLLKDINFRK